MSKVSKKAEQAAEVKAEVQAEVKAAEVQAAAPAPAPAPAPVPKAPKDSKNDVTRPRADTACGKIWAIADKHTHNGTLRDVPRAKIFEECAGLGINSATVSTQYARWRKYHGLTGVSSSGVKMGRPAKEGGTAPKGDVLNPSMISAPLAEGTFQDPDEGGDTAPAALL